MLVLSRRLNQTIVIGGRVRVTVLAITANRVELGVEAPRRSWWIARKFTCGGRARGRLSLRSPIPERKNSRQDRQDRQGRKSRIRCSKSFIQEVESLVLLGGLGDLGGEHFRFRRAAASSVDSANNIRLWGAHEHQTRTLIASAAAMLIAAGATDAAEPEKWPMVIPAPHGSVILPDENSKWAYDNFRYAAVRRVGDTLYISGVVIGRAKARSATLLHSSSRSTVASNGCRPSSSRRVRLSRTS